MEGYVEQKDFLKYGGNICPSCRRTILIARLHPPESGTKRTLKASCLVCSAKWEELWMKENPSSPLALAGYQNLVIFPESTQ